MGTRSLGAAGEALIKSFEKLELMTYPDQGGVLTIGWGHTGPDVEWGTVWTADHAETVFLEDVAQAVAAVNAGATEPMTQNQFDAMVCFTFNVGGGAFFASTLRRLQNAGDVQDAADQFSRWTKVRGVVSNGLIARRAAEQKLFLTPDQ